MNIFVNGQCRPKLFTLIYGGFWIFSIVSPSVDFTTFEKVHFLYGNNITVTNDLGSLLECLRICRTNCGYVQYTDTGLCVLYSEVLLLTEPAVTEGQMVGYRKVCNIQSLLRSTFLLAIAKATKHDAIFFIFTG